MSPFFLITASKQTEYQVEVEAEEVDLAIEIVRGYETSGELEKYVYETSELEIDEVEELEEE
jgi:hypothetical protein